MTLYARVSSALDEAGKQTARQETQRIRTNAVQAGWPREEAATLEVHYGEGHLHTSFSDSAADYEYGTEDRPPLSVARQWQHRLDEMPSETLAKNLRESMRGWM